MSRLSPESAVKLQKILSKRIGHELTSEELEQTYSNLMDFAFALVDLTPIKEESSDYKLDYKQPIAFANYPAVY